MLIGVGLIAAGVPAAGLLTAAALVLAIVQIGPGIVILGVLVWAWTTIGTAGAAVLTAWLVAAVVLESVLKPVVMAKGLKTPMLVVLLGVIGGTLAHGLVGLFVGPIVLAVLHDLARAWIAPPAARR
jgi:predicted PurR-regulated permease PerM